MRLKHNLYLYLFQLAGAATPPRSTTVPSVCCHRSGQAVVEGDHMITPFLCGHGNTNACFIFQRNCHFSVFAISANSIYHLYFQLWFLWFQATSSFLILLSLFLFIIILNSMVLNFF